MEDLLLELSEVNSLLKKQSEVLGIDPDLRFRFEIEQDGSGNLYLPDVGLEFYFEYLEESIEIMDDIKLEIVRGTLLKG